MQRTPFSKGTAKAGMAEQKSSSTPENQPKVDEEKGEKEKPKYIGDAKYDGFNLEDHMKLVLLPREQQGQYKPGDFIPFHPNFRERYLIMLEQEAKLAMESMSMKAEAAGGGATGGGATSGTGADENKDVDRKPVGLTSAAANDSIFISDNDDGDDPSDPSDDDGFGGNDDPRRRREQNINITPNTRLPNMKYFVPVPDSFENTKRLRNYFQTLIQPRNSLHRLIQSASTTSTEAKRMLP